MLSTDFPEFLVVGLAGFALVFAALALFLAKKSRDYARACASFARETASAKLDRAKIAELDASITELTDAYDALLKSHKKLRSRLTMRANRQDAGNGVDLSNETEKKRLRLQCRERGLLK